MALLASCWLIIEVFVIPDGFLKWFFLSFYIHPFFLAFCQIFLWLKALQKWLLHSFVFPLRIVCYLNSFILRSFKTVADFLFPFVRPKSAEVFYDAVSQEIPRFPNCDIAVSCAAYRVTSETRYVSGVFEMRDGCEDRSSFGTFEDAQERDWDSRVKDSWLDEYLSSDHYNNALLAYYDLNSNQDFANGFQDSEIRSSQSDDHQSLEDMLVVSQGGRDSPDFNVALSPTEDVRGAVGQQLIISRSVQEDTDSFHQKYIERMRFFDVLYHERLYGMNAILNGLLMGSSAGLSTARKKILRSLECDFELIYVAQSCLSWEALYHQYQKVEALTFSDNSENTLFHHSVSGKFQDFQILLERFVEEEKSEGQRYSSNYTQKRLSLQCLLHVPDVTGFMVEESYDMGEESIRASQVLKAIEKCIEAFWQYVKTDNDKPSWKSKCILRPPPPVEDPRDLELLYSVTKELRKKGILLKDLRGKKKCWLVRRKVKPVEAQDEGEKRNDVLFAMIEMKLVQRLLKMPLISASHLNWCQEKLKNLEFKRGKVLMGPKSLLFPSS